MDVMTAGRMAILVDPAGARLSIWQPGDHIGAGLANVPDSLCWNELVTPDFEKAKAFYGPLFGWSFEIDNEDSSAYLMIKLGDRLNGGARELGGDPMPPHWMPYIAVESADATGAKAKSLGGQVMVPPTDIAPGRFSVIADPQGGVLTVMKLHTADD